MRAHVANRLGLLTAWLLAACSSSDATRPTSDAGHDAGGGAAGSSTGGASGAAGTAGTGGTSGAAGTAGTGGTSGAAGTAGTGGTSGAAGTAGTGGTSGAAGSSTGGASGAGTGGTAGASASGIPFGPFGMMASATQWNYGPAPFTLTLNFMAASTIVAFLDAARAQGVHLVLAMTGGSHDNYITGGAFDRSKWNARMDTFDTPEIRQKVSERVADGTVIAASVMDEPDHVSWGGVMNGAEIDSMSAYVKALFPTLPTATVVQLDWQPTYVYSSLDFLIRQFSYDLFPAQGPNEPGAYRDQTIAQAAAQHVGVLFSMNILDGGARVTGCPYPTTGGPGTYGPNCRMTPAEVLNAADALTQLGACGLLMWQQDATYFADAGQVAAFTSAATLLATRTQSRCAH